MCVYFRICSCASCAVFLKTVSLYGILILFTILCVKSLDTQNTLYFSYRLLLQQRLWYCAHTSFVRLR